MGVIHISTCKLLLTHSVRRQTQIARTSNRYDCIFRSILLIKSTSRLQIRVEWNLERRRPGRQVAKEGGDESHHSCNLWQLHFPALQRRQQHDVDAEKAALCHVLHLNVEPCKKLIIIFNKYRIYAISTNVRLLTHAFQRIASR